MHTATWIIVFGTAFSVAEYSVGFVDLLEPILVSTAVRMMLHGLPSEGPFDIIFAGVAWHAQDLVVVFHLVIIAWTLPWVNYNRGFLGGGGGGTLAGSLLLSHLFNSALPAQAAM